MKAPSIHRPYLEDGRPTSDSTELQSVLCYRRHTDDAIDAAIMSEFSSQDGHMRATLTPITLATIGLDADEVRAIARAHWGIYWPQSEHITIQGSEHISEPASLEHITLESRLDWVQAGLFEEC